MAVILLDDRPLVDARSYRQRDTQTSEFDKHISSYTIDYARALGATTLPQIPIQTLSADWWAEVKKYV